MTDISKEAVEVLARIIGGRAPNNTEHDQIRAANTLLALSARVAELENINGRLERQNENLLASGIQDQNRQIKARVAELEAGRHKSIKEFLTEFTEHKFDEVRNFTGPSPEDELEATTEHGPVAAFQEDAQALLEAVFPKRCKGGDIDAFNGDCLWCGAPMGGACQNLEALKQGAGE